MKKNYSIDVHYEVVLSTDVIAESKDEAISKAIEELTHEDLNIGKVLEETGVVTDVETLEDEEVKGIECPDDIAVKPIPTNEKPLLNQLDNGFYGAVCTSPEDIKTVYEFLKFLFGEK